MLLSYLICHITESQIEAKNKKKMSVKELFHIRNQLFRYYFFLSALFEKVK